LVLVLICLVLYFAPSCIALARGKRNSGAIFALNLFLGWTLVGWVVSFVWACTVDATPVLVAAGGYPAPFDGGSLTCPHCRSTIPAMATVCRFCQRDVPSSAAVPAKIVSCAHEDLEMIDGNVARCRSCGLRLG
jgi:hypothetical protein